MIYGVHTAPIVNKGDALAARKTVEIILEKNSNFPDCYFQIAKTYVTEGNNAAAQEALMKALELNPDYFEAQLFRVRLLLEQGKLTKARHEIQPIRAKYDVYADVAFLYGLILYTEGEYPDALTEARRAIEKNPHYRDAHLLELIIYHKAGRIEEFSRKRQHIDSVEPNQVGEKCFYHGLRFFEQAQYISSIFYFDAAAVVGMDKWVCLFNSACAMVHMNWISEAHTRFKKILEYRPEFKNHIMHDRELDPYRATEQYAALNVF